MGAYAGAQPTVGDLLQIVDIRTKIVSVSSLLVGSGWALATAPERFSWGLFGLMAAGDARSSTWARRVSTATSISHGRGHARVGPGAVQGARAAGHRPAHRAAPVVRALCGGRAPGARHRRARGLGRGRGGRLLHGLRVLLLGRAAPDLAHARRRVLRGRAAGRRAGGDRRPSSTRSGWTPPRILVGIPSSLIIAGILSTNNACDRVGDERAGRRTLAIALGPRRSHLPVFALVAATYAAIVLLAALRVLPPWAFLPMVALRGACLAHARGHESARLVACHEGARTWAASRSCSSSSPRACWRALPWPVDLQRTTMNAATAVAAR